MHVKVGGIPAVGLIDTGAICSLLSKTFFQRIKKTYQSSKLDIIGTERIKLENIDDRDIKRIGAQIQIAEEFKIRTDLLIVENSSFDIVILR